MRDRAIRRTATGDTDADDGVELALDFFDGLEVLRQPIQRRLELDDRGEHFFLENFRFQLSRRPVFHEQRHRVVRLELRSQRRQGHGDFLDVAEAHPDTRPTEVDHHARLALRDAPGDVVGLDFLGAPASEPRVIVHHQRVAEGAPQRARPFEVRRLERTRGTAIERLVETQP
jgi:hypothetical protein